MPLVFSDDFTGANNDPPDSTKWIEDNNGTGDLFIDTNRLAIAVSGPADVGRASAYLNLIDARVDCPVEIPNGLSEASTQWALILPFRWDGVWSGGHDINNGYMLTIRRYGAGIPLEGGGTTSNGDVVVANFRVDAGVVSFIADEVIVGGESDTDFLFRAEVVGDNVRSIARLASAGSLPDNMWDLQTVDTTFTEGRLGLSSRGPTGASPPVRTGYLDDFQVSVPGGGGGRLVIS